jgi:guanylate kinase
VEYDYVVVNDELEACVDRVRAIVLAERTRLRSARWMAEGIVKTFAQGSTDRKD